MDINRELIRKINSLLIDAYNPLSIYLFGSYAWGNPQTFSDIDIMVIVKDTDLDIAERIRTGLRNLKGIHVPVDILVYTEAEIAEHKNHPSTLIHKVIEKGVKLYETA